MRANTTAIRPRLAILGTRGIPARYGGFESFAEEISARLASLGFDVTVYCEVEGAGGPTEHRGVKLRYVSAPRIGPLTTILFDLRCLLHAMRHVDVIYLLGHGASLFCCLPRMFGVRVWINMDGIEWQRSKWNALGRAYLRLSEWAATVSAHVLVADAFGIRDYLQRRFANLPPVEVIPYGAHVIEAPPPTELLRDWGLSPGGYYLVVARLEPENHVLEMIEGYLAAGAREPLVVVGGLGATRYHERLRGLAGGNVRFIGGVYDPARLVALRYHCKAYLHGHSVGGTNPSLLEALGAGNLVVAHDNPFNREVLDGEGWYFRTSQEVPAALSQVASLSKGERHAIGDRMRTRVRTAYSWESVLKSYVELLEREGAHVA